MLRNLLIALGGFLVAAGIVTGIAMPAAVPFWLWMIGGGCLLLLGTVFEKVLYKPVERTPPGPGWQRTSERFVDENSGKTITVFIHPETGERKYVED